jgi:hypothetical protein
MPDPIIADTPFGETPAWPPSPARLDRELDAQNNQIINVDWTGDPINLSTDVTGQLPYANIQNVTAQRLLGRDSGTGIVQEIVLGSNLTLTGGTLSAATSGGAGTGDFSTNTSSSVANEIVLFSNTTGKQGKRSTGTGALRVASGVMAVGPLPLSTDVSGTLPAANMPALTGAVTSTVGTVATTIAPLAVTNAMLAGGITASNLVGSDISVVGTITAGNWAASPIPVAHGGTGTSSIAAARAALGIEARTDVGDADYTILSTDRTVNLTASLTAVRTFTLPLASSVNPGTELVIVDSAGGVSTTNYIQIARAGSDTINAGTNPFLLLRKYDLVRLTATATQGWVVSATQPVINKSFTSNQTYTTPVGVKALFVECIGGGGGGGGAAIASSNLSLGSGGGGGGYSSIYIAAPVASYLITLGAGGAGVSGGTGNTGGTTSFAAVCSASGGIGGTVMAAGTSLIAIQGASGGAGTAGDVGFQGSAGGGAIRLSSSTGISGAGGMAALGFGPSSQQVVSNFPGQNGGQWGGGGGGGFNTTGVAVKGGDGGQGIVRLVEYY